MKTNSDDESGSLWCRAAGWSSSLYSDSPVIDLAEGPGSDRKLRWWKLWRGQQRLRKRPARMTASAWQQLPGKSRLLSPPYASPTFFFLVSAFLFFAPQDSVERWRETEPSQTPPGHYQPHTCCLVLTPAL